MHRTASNLAVDELRRRACRPVAEAGPLEAHPAPERADDRAAREALEPLAPHDPLVLLLRFHAGCPSASRASCSRSPKRRRARRVGRAGRRFADALHAVRREPGPLVLLLVREEAPEP